MVVNNWYVTCNMYCVVVNSTWPIAYFISFWGITVLVMLNLVISFVLEIYGNVSAEVEAEFKRREYVMKLQS
mgnify:CR=1 FL=1|jgi:hypothetical protein